MAHVRTHGEAGELKDAGHSTSLAGAGWCTETMDEAMWSKMRLEEEEKEAAGIEAPAMEVLGRRRWWGITA